MIIGAYEDLGTLVQRNFSFSNIKFLKSEKAFFRIVFNGRIEVSDFVMDDILGLLSPFNVLLPSYIKVQNLHLKNFVSDTAEGILLVNHHPLAQAFYDNVTLENMQLGRSRAFGGPGIFMPWVLSMTNWRIVNCSLNTDLSLIHINGVRNLIVTNMAISNIRPTEANPGTT